LLKLQPRRRKRLVIPEELRREVVAFGRRLAREYAANFADPRLKHRLARLLAAELPPARRRPGRPGLAAVTDALKMLDELRHAHPGKPARILWRSIYPVVIQDFYSLDKVERRAAQQELRDRTRWRRWGRRRSRIGRKMGV
jgi:hypothetical protein